MGTRGVKGGMDMGSFDLGKPEDSNERSRLQRFSNFLQV